MPCAGWRPRAPPVELVQGAAARWPSYEEETATESAPAATEPAIVATVPTAVMRLKISARPQSPARRHNLLRVDRRWAWHYRTLVALRDHLVAEAQADTSDATDRFDRDFIRALLAREADPLAEINAAIDRILHGSYGVCVATGRPMPAARLRSAPWVRYGDAAGHAGIVAAGPGTNTAPPSGAIPPPAAIADRRSRAGGTGLGG